MGIVTYDGNSFSASVGFNPMTAGLAANAEILQMRWSDAVNLRRIRILAVEFSAANDTVAFTAGSASFGLNVARSWTVDGTGGSALSVTGNNQKLRQTQNPAIGTTVRRSTGTALGAGTKTLDSFSHSSIASGVTGVIGQQIVDPNTFLWKDLVTAYGQPIILAHQEGITITADVPATGTWRWNANIFWAEVD